MKSETIYRIKELLVSVSNIYAGQKVEFENELIESFEDIFDLDKDVFELNQYLNSLSSSLSTGDKQACIESIAVIRSLLMNVESAYSNLTDTMSNLVVYIRDNQVG